MIRSKTDLSTTMKSSKTQEPHLSITKQVYPFSRIPSGDQLKHRSIPSARMSVHSLRRHDCPVIGPAQLQNYPQAFHTPPFSAFSSQRLHQVEREGEKKDTDWMLTFRWRGLGFVTDHTGQRQLSLQQPIVLVHVQPPVEGHQIFFHQEPQSPFSLFCYYHASSVGFHATGCWKELHNTGSLFP